jgi:dynactin 1
VLEVFGKAALGLATTSADNSVPAPRLHEALHTAVDSATEFGDRGIEFCAQSLAAASAKLAAVATAIQNGEFDFDGSREEKAVPPIVLRAEDVKAEIREATGMFG